MITVDANLFRVAAMFASTDVVLCYINGVRIEKHPTKGVLLIATDRHRLFVAHDPKGRCAKPKTILLDRLGLKACVPKRGAKGQLEISVEGIATIGAYHSVASVINEGRAYPDWLAVVPVQQWKNAPASFNGEYLGSFGEAVRALNGARAPSIRILTGSTVFDAALILFPSFNDAFGMLMPMQADVDAALPAWMMPVMKTKQKTKPESKKPATKAKQRK